MKDPSIRYCNQFMIQRTTVEDTDNRMSLKEHEIRDNWKVETKGNIKDP